MTAPERMDAFFAARVGDYDTHMLENVEGCREGYAEMARRIPADTKTLLDLGCGTGLELDAIFPRFPGLAVTGIDLTREMLEVLRQKHPHRNLTLLCGDYFTVPFGTDAFDCAVSFETMHHFPPEKKHGLYRKIHDALHPGGYYLECDYMVDTPEEEALLFAESDRLRREEKLPDGVFYHIDTPCCINRQLRLLTEAGFFHAEHVFRLGGTSLIGARKLI